MAALAALSVGACPEVGGLFLESSHVGMTTNPVRSCGPRITSYDGLRALPAKFSRPAGQPGSSRRGITTSAALGGPSKNNPPKKRGTIIKKPTKQEKQEPRSDFGTQIFKAFGKKSEDSGTKSTGTKKVGGALVLQRREDSPLVALGAFGRGRKADPKVVFVSGATGQSGSRVTKELLRAGFTVRAGVPDIEFAQQLAEFATQYGVLKPDEARRLNVVEFDLRSEESVAKAIGNAGNVVVTLGPSEDGPRGKVDTKDALRVVEAATVARSTNFVLVSPSSSSGGGGGLLNLFGVFGGSQSDSAVISKIIENGLKYTVIRTGSINDSIEDGSIVLEAEGTVKKAGVVSRDQVAEVVAGILSNLSVSENKVLEVASDPSAASRPIADLLKDLPVDGRKAALEEAKLKAEAEAAEREARAVAAAEAAEVAESARAAAAEAAALQVEAQRIAQEEARLAAAASKAEARAKNASEVVSGVATRLSRVAVSGTKKVASATKTGTGLFGAFASQKAATPPAAEESEAEEAPRPAPSFGFKLPSPSFAAFSPGAPASKPTISAPEAPAKRRPTLKSARPVTARVRKPVEEPKPPPKPVERKSFGGIFKQETIYADDSAGDF